MGHMVLIKKWFVSYKKWFVSYKKMICFL